MLSPTQRFSNRVEYYVRSRPKYPPALLQFFRDDLGLLATDPVADIGSGTGFLTELFVRNGNPAFAVEPNEPMRKAAEEYLGQSPNFHSINGTAEATTLPASRVRFATAAQAFHWFNVDKAAVEFKRILKPGGIAALIWNERTNDATPFMMAYDQLIKTYSRPGEPARAGMPEGDGAEAIKHFFGPGGHRFAEFENPQILDATGLMDRICSSSYMPLPGDAVYEALVSSVRELFEQHQDGGVVRIEHQTHIYYGTLS